MMSSACTQTCPGVRASAVWPGDHLSVCLSREVTAQPLCEHYVPLAMSGAHHPVLNSVVLFVQSWAGDHSPSTLMVFGDVNWVL